MQMEIESTIPINLIRPRRSTDGMTPPPDVDVEFTVRLRSDSEANLYSGLLEDTPAGVFVPTYRSHPLGTLVAIALDVPGRDDLLVVNTVVRWHRDETEGSDAPPGMGLEFLHVAGKARALLERFAAARPPLLFEI
jgi:Tfp pilus assembly protein PilZ